MLMVSRLMLKLVERGRASLLITFMMFLAVSSVVKLRLHEPH